MDDCRQGVCDEAVALISFALHTVETMKYQQRRDSAAWVVHGCDFQGEALEGFIYFLGPYFDSIDLKLREH